MIGLPRVVPGCGPRWLLIAPHPDDEALAGSALLQSVPGDAWIVYLTAGDAHRRAAAARSGHVEPTPADYLALGRARLADSGRAAAALGLAPDRLLHLGFPDGALLRVLASDQPVVSPTTGVSAVPYAGAVVPGAPYTRQALLHALAVVADRVRPGALASPSYTDGHPDHRAGSDVAGLLAGPAGTWLSYLVHDELYPWPWGYAPARLLQPSSAALPGPRLALPQSAAREAAQVSALRAYRTEWRVDAGWMSSFVARSCPYGVVRP